MVLSKITHLLLYPCLETIDMASHKYAILKFFGFVVWVIAKEPVHLNAGKANTCGPSKPKVFLPLRKATVKKVKPGADWVTVAVSVVYATFN